MVMPSLVPRNQMIKSNKYTAYDLNVNPKMMFAIAAADVRLVIILTFHKRNSILPVSHQMFQRGLSEAQNGYGFGMIPAWAP